MDEAYRLAVDAAAIFSETDLAGNITYVNDQFCAISGYTAEELSGQNHRILNSGHHPREFFVELWGTILHRKIWKGEICNRAKDGTLYWVESTILGLLDPTTNRVLKYVSIRFEVTEKRQLLQILQWRAGHDVLTDLPNRFLLTERLDQAIANRSKQQLAVGVLDLDGFKQVNDSYGHAVGDRLLIEVARRLMKVIRGADIVARLGGDEFVLILNVLNLDELKVAIHRIMSAVSTIYSIDRIRIHISASIGVTIYPADNEDADTLLRHADQAMYQAKQNGRNCVRHFDVSLEKAEKVAFDTVARIRLALELNELVLYYQPKVNLRSGVIEGFEALLRWQHPQEGMILPMAFLPRIERTELIVEIGEWVINEALTQITLWAKAGYVWSLSVNIAAFHFQKRNFANRLETLLACYPYAPPNSLDIEIVESVVLDDFEQVAQCLTDCQKLGVTFSLDDFGTGYSSLSYLKLLPTQTIKIDQSFIRNILEDKDDLALTEIIIGLAKVFGRKVVAEGVETMEHSVRLMHLGCDIAQGYGIAKPMRADHICEWVKQYVPHSLIEATHKEIRIGHDEPLKPSAAVVVLPI
jgi:diguanylate cyclase (GGDEF)-like protein/PAS domain S-box-containing protein